jgi:DNA-binding NtrC family response regulator
VPAISPELSQQFLACDWPGNVRQLENLIKRIVVLGTEAGIARELLQPIVPGPRAVPSPARAVAAASPPRLDGALPSPPPAAALRSPNGRDALGGGGGGPVAVASRGGAAAVETDAPAGASGLSLKDIARTAAREAERDLILRMLTRTRWNRKEAAQNLGISYKALLYKIKDNGLDRAS